ncbi:unnamed protein product [Urochloa decumbens]|uniref:Late embryogenesis abundant protein LEA-2 subgroup domain-containing protein n=1 Tax=Urochloa decumbens TaxID=240449 RepID=A0ABC9E5D2_9POAL
MAAVAAGRRPPEAKDYILLALAATLAAAAVVTVVFVVLSPARVVFSVTSAASHPSSDGGLVLDLTIAAANPSRRAAVRYQSMFVDVSNNTGPKWTNWVRANVTAAAALPLLQPTRNVTEINATVALVGGPWADGFTGKKTSHGFGVLVTTMARFKVGASLTRLYDIKVFCGPVDFFAKRSGTANCTAA